MKIFRDSGLTAEARRELEAIDATLRDESVGAEHTRLADLTRELRASRPRPEREFVRALDDRAARGFIGEARSGEDLAGRSQKSRLLWRARGLRPALAASLTLLIVAAVALPFALSGGRNGRSATPDSAPAAPVLVEEARPRHGEAAKSTARAPLTSASAAAATAPRQVERTTTLEVGLAPNAIQSTSQRVFTLVSAFGGYVRQSNVSSGSVGQAGATFDLRIPSSNLSGAIASLSHLGHVRAENDTTNDVTEQFNSLRGSLANLQAERASLLKQLAAASEAQQEAALKERLRSVDGRISQLEGQLAALRGRVDYTSVALTLTSEAPVGSKQGDLTPGGAARDAGQILEAALAVVVIGLAALVPLGALGLAAWLIVLGTRRRKREQALDASV